MDSILTSVKKMIGVHEDDTSFDVDIILAINSVFSILYQLGVGPKTSQFVIHGTSETWTNFMVDGNVEMVKNYVGLKVKMIFDPPTIGTLAEAYKNQIAEYEWRLNVAVENGDGGVGPDDAELTPEQVDSLIDMLDT